MATMVSQLWSSNQSPQSNSSKGKSLVKGTPVRACVRLSSCLTPVKVTNTPTSVSAKKSLQLDEKVSPCKKEVAIFLERHTVKLSYASAESNKCDASIPGLQLKNSPIDTVGMQVDVDVHECPSDDMLPDPLWFEDLKVVRDWENVYRNKITKIEPDRNLSLSYSNGSPSGSHSSTLTTMDADLTPPASSDSASTSSIDIESYAPESFPKNLEEDILVEKTPSSHPVSKLVSSGLQSILCTKLEVRIAPIEANLSQMKALYQRKRCQSQNSFRNRHLRPKQSLRQFVPFAIKHPKRKLKNISMKHKNMSMRKTDHTKNPQKKHVQKAKQEQLKLELMQKQEAEKQKKEVLRQKKEAIKLRNNYENALNSINQRLMRQNHFWRTFAV